MNKKQLIIFRALLLAIILSISQLAFSSVEPAIQEANEKFTYQGKPIHPGLVQEFESLSSDSGEPTTIAVDIAAKHSNEYFDDDVAVEKDGAVIYKKSERESYSYKWLGRLNNGLHILKVEDWGGGSGIFMSLLFVKFDVGEGYTDEGEKYQRLLMSIVRRYSLGDRYDGEIKIAGDSISVGAATKDCVNIDCRKESTILKF